MDFKVTRATTRQVAQVASSPTCETNVICYVLREVETSNLSCSVRVGPKAPVFGSRFRGLGLRFSSMQHCCKKSDFHGRGA